MNLLNSSLISKSEARSFGPEWYQPIIRSRADREVIIEKPAPTIRHLLTVDLFKHLKHGLDIVVIEKPSFAVLLIFLKGNPVRICHIYSLAIVLTKKHADNTFMRTSGHRTSMMVGDRQEDEGVNDCSQVNSLPKSLAVVLYLLSSLGVL